MKLSEVSTKDLKESLKALADLRRKYEGKRQYTKYSGDSPTTKYSCPLCNFGKDQVAAKPTMDCYCPWVWIDEKPCVIKDADRVIIFAYYHSPIPTRLKRVARWEAKTKAEIEGR